MKIFESVCTVYKLLQYNDISLFYPLVGKVAEIGTISHFKHGYGYEERNESFSFLFIA